MSESCRLGCHVLAETRLFCGSRRGRKGWEWIVPKKTGRKW